MAIVEESNFLLPSGGFLVGLVRYALLVSLLVLWPLIGAVLRREWGWVLLIVIFGPFAGVLWFFMRRRVAALG